jgi:hypothetical protein
LSVDRRRQMPSYFLFREARPRASITLVPPGPKSFSLSIAIFGGWNPFRAAFGVYLFSVLQWLGLVLQPFLPSVPTQVLQVAPVNQRP